MRTPDADHRPPARRDPAPIWVDPLPDDDDTDDIPLDVMPAGTPDRSADEQEM